VSPPASSVSLRRAAAEDESFMKELYFEWRRPEFALLPFPEPQIRDLLQMQYRAQITSYSASFPSSGYEIILLNGERAGRIWIARQADEIRLVDILIAPSRRNQGIGTVLMHRLQEEARNTGLPIRATVDRANPGSLRFHQRHGFQVSGEGPLDLSVEWNP
jgi:GNAT superfamily N-acetyltransferase